MALVAAIPVLARQNANASQGSKGREGQRVDVVVRAGGVNITAQQTIQAYYADKPKKARALQPDVARKYARGRRLPPGIAKQSLPPDLERRLSAQPGYQYVAVDSDVLLIAVSTGIVVDILFDVL
jgi:Ni/Co efflux regulator RcnB